MPVPASSARASSADSQSPCTAKTPSGAESGATSSWNAARISATWSRPTCVMSPGSRIRSGFSSIAQADGLALVLADREHLHVGEHGDRDRPRQPRVRPDRDARALGDEPVGLDEGRVERNRHDRERRAGGSARRPARTATPGAEQQREPEHGRHDRDRAIDDVDAQEEAPQQEDGIGRLPGDEQGHAGSHECDPAEAERARGVAQEQEQAEDERRDTGREADEERMQASVEYSTPQSQARPGCGAD